jgi:hypothetical protein
MGHFSRGARTGPQRARLRSFLLVLLIASLVAGCASSPPSSSSTGPTTSTPGATPGTSTGSPATGKAASAALEVVSTTTYRDATGNFHVVGEVIDHGPQNASYIDVRGEFKDANGTLVKSDTTVVMRTTVPAGEKGPFDLFTKDPGQRIATFPSP